MLIFCFGSLFTLLCGNKKGWSQIRKPKVSNRVLYFALLDIVNPHINIPNYRAQKARSGKNKGFTSDIVSKAKQCHREGVHPIQDIAHAPHYVRRFDEDRASVINDFMDFIDKYLDEQQYERLVNGIISLIAKSELLDYPPFYVLEDPDGSLTKAQFSEERTYNLPYLLAGALQYILKHSIYNGTAIAKTMLEDWGAVSIGLPSWPFEDHTKIGQVVCYVKVDNSSTHSACDADDAASTDSSKAPVSTDIKTDRDDGQYSGEEFVNTHDGSTQLPKQSSGGYAERVLFSSDIYKNLVEEISELRCDIEEMSPENPRRQKKLVLLNQRMKELEELKKVALDIVRQISEMSVDSKRATEARTLFEQGKFDEADAVLSEESLQRDSQHLREQGQRIGQEQDAHSQRCFDLAMEYVLKAKLKLMNIKDMERFDEADELFNEATRISRAPKILYEYGHFLIENRVSHNRVNGMEKPIELLSEALDKLDSSNEQDKINIIPILMDLACAYQSQPDKAEVVTRRALDLIYNGSAHLMNYFYNGHTLRLMINLAASFQINGRAQDAEVLLRQVIDTCKRTESDASSGNRLIHATALYNIALLHRQADNLDLAISEFREAIKLCDLELQENPDSLDIKEHKALVLFILSRALALRCLHEECMTGVPAEEAEIAKYHEEAIKVATCAVEIIKKLLEINPSKYEQQYHSALSNLLSLKDDY